jgi:hypothetical protein
MHVPTRMTHQVSVRRRQLLRQVPARQIDSETAESDVLDRRFSGMRYCVHLLLMQMT